MSTAAILVVAILFLVMGGYGLLSPSALIRPFGIALPTAVGRAEVRAVYGGFGVAVAVVLALSGLNVGGIRTGAVTAVAVALLGMATGRLIARVAEPVPGFYPVWFYFWVEVAGASVLLVAAFPDSP